MAKRKSCIDLDKIETVLTRQTETGPQVVLPYENVDAADLPEVTVICVTRNRKKFAPILCDNWKRTYYPYDKISLLVIDDSDTVEQSPIRELKAMNDKRILFYRLTPIDGKPYSIGYKRNFGINLSKTEYVAMMDDDDFIFDESILIRICALNFYKKQCVFSSEIGIYNTRKETSYVAEGFADVAEGSLLFTKSFWIKSKFNEDGSSEGVQLVRGQELDMLRISFVFNLIVINHGSNTTGRVRDFRLILKGKAKEQMSMNPIIDFKKIFPESFQKSLISVTDNAKI